MFVLYFDLLYFQMFDLKKCTIIPAEAQSNHHNVHVHKGVSVSAAVFYPQTDTSAPLSPLGTGLNSSFPRLDALIGGLDKVCR